MFTQTQARRCVPEAHLRNNGVRHCATGHAVDENEETPTCSAVTMGGQSRVAARRRK